MGTNEQVEARLRAAIAVTPSADGLRSLDERVLGMIARPALVESRRSRRWRVLARPLPLAAAFLLLAGVAVGGVSLLERTIDKTPGWRTAWDQAVVLGLEQADSGYTLTLERAYADVNQVMVFLTIEGLEAPTSSDGTLLTSGVAWAAELRGPTGRQMSWSTAAGPVERDSSVIVQAWGPADPVAGAYTLSISCIEAASEAVEENCGGDLTGNWRFEFELPEPVGTIVHGDASDVEDGATVTLSELRVSPTMISARIAMHVDDRPVAYWNGTNPTIRRDDVTFEVNGAWHVLVDDSGDGPAMEFQTTEGADEATGTWTIEIPEQSYAFDNLEEPAIAGPWTLTVSVP